MFKNDLISNATNNNFYFDFYLTSNFLCEWNWEIGPFWIARNGDIWLATRRWMASRIYHIIRVATNSYDSCRKSLKKSKDRPFLIKRHYHFWNLLSRNWYCHYCWDFVQLFQYAQSRHWNTWAQFGTSGSKSRSCSGIHHWRRAVRCHPPYKSHLLGKINKIKLIIQADNPLDEAFLKHF